jgi:capsule polysaccharide export protein KpsE/RkpR
MRIFIEKRLASAEQDLKEASDSLKSFQERNKVVALDEETKAVIDAYAQLKSELLKREIELGVSEDISTQDNPYVLSIKREIDEFKNQLQEMESGKKAGKGFGVGFAISFQKLPAVAQEYARRYRDYKAQEEIYALLLQQYEQAKILEARDTPNITVLDYARIPEKKDSPKKLKIVINVFVITLILSVLSTFVLEYWGKMRQNRSDEYKSWREIINAFQNDLSKIKRKLQSKSRSS